MTDHAIAGRRVGSAASINGLAGLRDQTWMEDALCRRRNKSGNPLYSLALWFPDAAKNYKWAKAICHTCPVRQQCLDWAMANEHGTAWTRYGIYGGLTPDERAQLAKETA